MMKRIGIIIILVLSSAIMLKAQNTSIDAIKTALVEFSSNVVAIECDFVQNKESSLLAETAVSSGHMTYRKPEHLEWVYFEPVPLAFIADGSNIALKRDGKEEALNGNQSRMVKEMSRIIIANIEGSALSNSASFKVEYNLTDIGIMTTLFPLKSNLQRLWSKFILYYDPANMNVKRFEMYESSGDLTIITFSNIKYDFSK